MKEDNYSHLIQISYSERGNALVARFMSGNHLSWDGNKFLLQITVSIASGSMTILPVRGDVD